ncbi:hypothetical protein SAMN05444266_103106 [Chitinophaga jiangningensis]|uniref:Uncharacterized protein n=1 Tax=Chitinophaga jiangningensis TaxID=1419482 RepID=A0A1M7A3G2_9BACT|nr:hypothetical protein [Chitinophaga jiangningensis]SHL37149.1 hypothetical protein SAMN05444266_103106 [Chitinophaga jiangningensis]
MAQSKPLPLSKKQIKEKVASGEFILDAKLSDKYNSPTYKSRNGNIITVNNKGGFIWSSLSDMLRLFELDSENTEAYDLSNWITDIQQLKELPSNTLDVLSAELKIKLDYSENSLNKLDKYFQSQNRIDRPVFLSLVYYSCELLSQRLGGTVTVDKLDAQSGYTLVVKDKKSRTYMPYVDLIECILEKEKCSLKEIIDLESQRYKLMDGA